LVCPSKAYDGLNSVAALCYKSCWVTAEGRPVILVLASRDELLCVGLNTLQYFVELQTYIWMYCLECVCVLSLIILVQSVTEIICILLTYIA